MYNKVRWRVFYRNWYASVDSSVFYIVQAHVCKCGMDVINVDLTEITATV